MSGPGLWGRLLDSLVALPIPYVVAATYAVYGGLYDLEIQSRFC